MLKLFDKKNSAKENRYVGEIRATQDGVAVPITEVPDDVISGGILGEGIAIVPHNGKVVAPVDGTVTNIAKSGHAFCVLTSDGLEVLVHIGVDTVTLNGQGFQVLVKEGKYVLAGTPICNVDLSILTERNLSTHTAILISNPTDFNDILSVPGEVIAGMSTVMQYKLKAGKE